TGTDRVEIVNRLAREHEERGQQSLAPVHSHLEPPSEPGRRPNVELEVVHRHGRSRSWFVIGTEQQPDRSSHHTGSAERQRDVCPLITSFYVLDLRRGTIRRAFCE